MAEFWESAPVVDGPQTDTGGEWWKDAPEADTRKKPDATQLFFYHVATNSAAAVAGLLRGLLTLPSGEKQDRALQDTIDAIEKWKKERLPQYYNVTPEDLNSKTSKVAAAGAAVGDMTLGPAAMISKMAGQTYGDAYAQAAAAAKESGATDPKVIDETARNAARNEVFKMAPQLVAYAAGGKLASKAAEKILPESAGAVSRFVVGGATSAGANLAVSGTMRAIEGHPITGDLQQNLTDVFFGAASGLHATPGRATREGGDINASEENQQETQTSAETQGPASGAQGARSEPAPQAGDGEAEQSGDAQTVTGSASSAPGSANGGLEEPTGITAEGGEPSAEGGVTPNEVQTVPADAGAVVPIPSEQIASRPDLMQFKRMDDPTKGTNKADEITSPYDPYKAGTLLLWEPNNPKEYGLKGKEKYIVANGHHRNERAQTDGIESQHAQILREADGFSAGDARAKGAELNIADGKGTIYDAAAFIRNEAATHGADAAVARSRQIGARGRKAATIGIESGPDLYSAFVNERITPDQAATVAEAAPKDAPLQRLGISRALKGDQPGDIANFIQAVRARMGGEAPPSAEQVDLFGNDDSAIAQAEAAAKRAGGIQKEIAEQIAAVRGAAKRPEKAAALGVDVKDPVALNAKLAQLQTLAERARNWSGDAEIRALALGPGGVDPGLTADEAVRELTGQAPVTSREGLVRKVTKRRAELSEHIAKVLKDAGDSGGVELRSRENPEHRLLVTPDGNEGAGKWRVTKIDDRGPYGHHVFDSREAALRAAAGESHTEIVKGPPYFAFRPYDVVRVTKPETKGPVEAAVKDDAKGVGGSLGNGDVTPAVTTDSPQPLPGSSFQPDDELIMHSPHTGEDVRVNYRGPLGNDKAVIWTGRSQIAVPMEWLRKPEIETTAAAQVDDPAFYKAAPVVEHRSAAAEPPQLRPGENQGDLLQGADQPFNLAGETAVDGDAIAKQKAEAEKKKQEADLWDEQNQIPFGFGPGAAAQGENLNTASQLQQLTGTVTSALKTAKPRTLQGKLQRAIQAVQGKAVTAKQRLTAAANTTRAAWLALKNGYLRPGVFGDFREAIKDWQGANQRTSFEVRQFIQRIRKEIRDPLVREAITNYIQADGDKTLLAQRAASSNAKYRPGYEAAMRLTPDQETFAANVRQYFDAMLADGINAGLLEHGIDNYINQVWRRPNKITRELQASIEAGKLQTSFQFARQRIFESFFAGEQAGYEPASKDVTALIGAYDLAFNRALSARALIKSLREAKAADGTPLVRFSGMAQALPKGQKPPDSYLIRARALPEAATTADGRPYRIVDHPALRGWRMLVQAEADAVPTYYQVDMLVHPDYAPQLRNILGTSWFRKNVVTSTFLKAGAIAKQTKLSLSLFHLDQEGLHGLFHRVNPANLARIDFNDPAQWALVRGGLQIADYRAMELFSEGLTGGGLVSKIPGLGRIQNAFNEFLFKDYIPRLKMTMALHAFERNTRRYPGLDANAVAELTARQGNAAFGELNYTLMARNPGVQDFLRLTVLAPDFLEARTRFVGQALKPYGAEQRAALMMMGATLYVTARALNKWLDDDPHWNKPFSVVYHGREYRLRTVLGDVGELITDPRRFFYNRFSPWLKAVATFGTGRDYRGVKLTKWEQVKDALSWLVPIPAGEFEGQGVVGDISAATRGHYAPVANRFLGASGVTNKPGDTAQAEAYEMAREFKRSSNDPKLRAEVRRADQETYAASDYKDLNTALLMGDNERAAREIDTLMKGGKDIPTLLKHYTNLPMSPFTGSTMLELQMLSKMPAPQRGRYNAAVQERVLMARRFLQIFPLVVRTRRK